MKTSARSLHQNLRFNSSLMFHSRLLRVLFLCHTRCFARVRERKCVCVCVCVFQVAVINGVESGWVKVDTALIYCEVEYDESSLYIILLMLIHIVPTLSCPLPNGATLYRHPMLATTKQKHSAIRVRISYPQTHTWGHSTHLHGGRRLQSHAM